MSASAGRNLARKAVTRIRERESYAHESLDAAVRRADLDRRDVAFATRLTYGTVAFRGSLDEIVAGHLRPGTTLEPLIADCLALSAYEILHMRTPKRAAVNEGVELVKSVQARAGGLANAVLRKVADAAPEFPWGDPATDDSALARLHGHPLWLCRLWIEELGRERAGTLMHENNEPAPLFLATLESSGTPKSTLDGQGISGADLTPGPLAGCFIAQEAHIAVSSPEVLNREILVIDAGAQFAASCVPLSKGSRVVEFGAGRGSKSLLIAARCRAAELDCDVVAIDVHANKLAALADDAERLGLRGITTLVADATDPLAEGMPEAGSVDAVLVDVPCSGLGTLRRHPDRRWRALPTQIETLSLLGTRFLESAASLVKPGGFVVYSTCTITRRENEHVVTSFLDSEAGSQFVIDPVSAEVPQEWRSFVTPEGWFQSIPQAGGPDGHFVARLRRTT